MNYDKYIGLPYLNNGRTEAGVDCWGLARLFYKDQFNIDLPSYSDEYVGGSDPAIVEIISIYKDNWEENGNPNIGDLCLFNILGEPTHVGIFIGENKFLHCRQGLDAVIESLDNIKWKNRFQGFYKYSEQSQIEAIGAPHPFKVSVHRDWTVEGTTVKDFVEFVKNKYDVSSTLASKIVIMIDGIVVSKNNWETTVLLKGQQIAYKSIAEGDSTKRLVLTFAVVVASVILGPQVGAYLQGGGAVAGSVGATAVSTGYLAAGSMIVNMAGMALMNVIAPIRPPTTNDAGSAAGMNLFTGASNQANKFGAIPVVLGKVRFTGVLGAIPYVESLTDTSILNTAIVWGFGPLDIDDICIGGSPIAGYYEGEPASIPRPVTLFGLADESTNAFDNLYGRDVEQQFRNLELVNNITDGNAWSTTTTLEQNCDAIDIVFSAPEGMRKINTKDGSISSTTAQIEIQVRPYSNTTWNVNDTTSSMGIYKLGNPDAPILDALAYSSILLPPSNPNGESNIVYRYTVLCLSPKGGIDRFDGAVTDIIGSNASPRLQTFYSDTSYTSLLGFSSTGSYIPDIPPGYIRLYTIKQSSNGVADLVTNHLTTYNGYAGLGYTIDPIERFLDDSNVLVDSTTKKITLGAGKMYSQTSGDVVNGSEEPIWDSHQISNASVFNTSHNEWGDFLKDYGVWGTGSTLSGVDSKIFTYSQEVNFPKDGYYMVEASADDEGTVTIGGTTVLRVPKPGMGGTIINPIKLTKGLHTITLQGNNSVGGNAGIACKITFTANSGLNITPSANTILIFGSAGFFDKRKDAFNWVQSIENLPRSRYQVRARRLNSDEAEDETDQHKYHKVVLTNVTGYDSQEKPMVNPPGCYLARTAIRVQSSNKVNGSIDSINAMVQSNTIDWDRATSTWVFRNTNNPASLFMHVLMHPANAFRVTNLNQFDLSAIIAWHNFCNPVPVTVTAGSFVPGRWYTINSSGNTNFTLIGAGSNNVGEGFEASGVGSGTGTAVYCPKFAYNSVLTSTQSVMDTLRDICAAGLASPTYTDGKWSVIVDTPRTHTIQHFTPHNSWGFEATKVLPILPHAFRISIADETLAFQANEIIIYNYGYAKTAAGSNKAAELFEQLSLPGVTNPDQATRLARWHFAQIKLRPETYTFSVDFEHLVCTRGDLVKVTHDVPNWGTGSGRVGTGVDTVLTGTIIHLTEEVYLETGKTYDILIRTNGLTSANNTGSITKRLATITTTGYTNTITITSALVSGDGVVSDNLFMLGEVNKVSQDCIVIAVEPSTNYSARLTLVDYAPEIYTADLSGLLVYNANISTVNTPLIKNSITEAPIINSVISDSPLADQISTGNYRNVAIVSFTNPLNLPAIASRVQFDYILGDVAFQTTNIGTTYITNKETSGYTFKDLTAGLMYKVRARYIDSTGNISGPWSEIFAFTNIGKDTNYYAPTDITVALEGIYLVALASSTATKPEDFSTFEYRFIQNSIDITDFWDLDPVTYNIKTETTGRLNLTVFPSPRLSDGGINYRVACRARDKSGNYSSASILGSISIKTIV